MNGASSDSRVFVKLYGEKGDTNKITLAVSDNDLRNYFEAGRTDIFTVETFDLGRVSFSDFIQQKRVYSSVYSSLFLTSSVFTDKPSPDRSQ